MEREYTAQEYWATVRSIAQDAWDESGQDIDTARDYAWESVDGSAWIIYYPGQLATIQHCSDEHAGWDAQGAEGILSGVETFWDVTMRTAAHALSHDVMEAIQTLAEEAEAEEEEGVDA